MEQGYIAVLQHPGASPQPGGAMFIETAWSPSETVESLAGGLESTRSLWGGKNEPNIESKFTGSLLASIAVNVAEQEGLSQLAISTYPPKGVQARAVVVDPHNKRVYSGEIGEKIAATTQASDAIDFDQFIAACKNPSEAARMIGLVPKHSTK